MTVQGRWTGRRSTLVCLAVGVVALVLRAWQPDHLGIGHYDEGVYAFSAQGVVTWPEGDLFPGQIRFSPPAWFASVGVAARALDIAPDQVALGLNIVIGAVTAAVVAAAGMAWFGVTTGVAAGLLVAANPLSVMLSRSGLTDPLFTLFFVLALAAVVHVLHQPGWRWVLVAGLLTGAAWNTKYHGWFVGLIGLGAICWIWWHERRERGSHRLVSRMLRLLAVGAIGFATYLPWATYMRSASGSRGFAAIVDYYLALIGKGWVDNAVRHAELQLFLDGTLARAGIALAVGTALALAAPLRVNRVLVLLVGCLLAIGIGGGLGALLLFAGVGLVALLTDPSRAAAGVLLAWVGLWVVAAPLYHPYARLLLPMIPAMALVAGRGVVALVQWAQMPGAARGMPRPAALATSGAMLLAMMVTPSLVRGVGDPWRDATGSRIAAARMALVTPTDAPIYVIGEPSLSYYLRREGRTVTDVVDGLDLLDTLSTPALLVAGVYARRTPSLREGLHRIAVRLDSLERYPAAPNDLRLLDDMTPDRARRFLVTPDTTFDMVLFRIRPSVAPATPSGSLEG